MPAKNSETVGKAEPRMSARVELENGAMRGKLHLYDAIGGLDGVFAKNVVAKLDELKDQGARALDVHVHSPGGDVFEGVAIHSALKGWDRGERHVHVDGLAASIASVIAMAGDKITIAPHAMMMIHGPRAIAIGTAAQMKVAVARLEAMKAEMVDCYAARTGLGKDEIAKMMDEETWMTAKAAVEKGFADAIAGQEIEEDGEETEGDEARFRAVASALFAATPPEALKLLKSSPLPVARVASAAQTQEQAMPAENKDLQEKVSTLEKSVSEMTAKVAAAEKVGTDLLTTTGKPTVGEALATVEGFKAQAARVPALETEVTALRDEKRQREITAMLDEASKAGRLTPAKREELSKADAPAFAKDPAQLKAFLDCLSPIVATSGASGERKPATPADGRQMAAELTDEEKAQAAKAGVSPEAFAVMKAGGAAAYDAYLAEKLKKEREQASK